MAAITQNIDVHVHHHPPTTLFPLPAPDPVPVKFGSLDVLRVFELLDKTRIQPVFGAGCRYADPDFGTPSCIAGTIISILAPNFFATACQREFNHTVKGLAGIGDVFTDDAILLLDLAQMYADGRHDGGGEAYRMTWGDAMLYGSVEALVETARRSMF